MAEALSAVVDDGKPSQPVASIDWKNPAKPLLLSLFLPVMLAFGVDLLLGTLPLITMVVGIICIPLSTVLVVRSILAEFTRVIEVVAPEQRDDAGIDKENDSQTGVIRPDASA